MLCSRSQASQGCGQEGAVTGLPLVQQLGAGGLQHPWYLGLVTLHIWPSLDTSGAVPMLEIIKLDANKL